jgi:hypothetical protein
MSGRPGRRFCPPLLVLVAAACGADANSSAGLPAGAPVAVADSARLELGVVTGDSIQEFDRVVMPFLLGDGRLVVPLRGKSVIRVFAPDGSHQATLGRYGEGPGEFMALSSAWARGDTIEAFDGGPGGGQRKIVRFLPDGSVREVRLANAPASEAVIPGTVRDGWAMFGIASASNGGRDQMIVQRFDRSGAHVGEMAHVEGMFRQQVPGASGPNPLSPRALFRVQRGDVYVAETLDPSIRVYEVDADSARVIRWDPGPPPAIDAAMRAGIDGAVAAAPAGQAESRRRMLESFPVPDRVSAFWDFLVDDLGFVWVRPFDPSQHTLYRGAGGPLSGGGPGGEWLIIAPDGATVGMVTLPADLVPMQVTRDAVVGIARDELEVEHVRVHPLERR